MLSAFKKFAFFVVGRLLAFFILTIICGFAAHATDLKPPIDFDNASVLPKGIRNFRLKLVTTEASNKYSDSSQVVPLGYKLNKQLTWAKLADGQAETKDRMMLKGYLEGKSIDTNQYAGESTGLVNVRASVTAPVLAYGVTDKWTAAIAVPIVYTNVSVESGFIAYNELQNNLSKQMVAEGKARDFEKMRLKLYNVIATKMNDYNYKPLANEKATSIGDIKLVNKYQIRKTEKYAVALKGELTLPTGRPPDVDKAVDVAPGSGVWNVGVGAVGEWFAAKRLSLVGTLFYLYQVPDHTSKRVPLTADDSLTPDIDPTIQRDIGDISSATTAVKYEISKGLTASTAYSFQYKEPDRYSGGRFSSDRYSLMSSETEQIMQAGQLGVGYSTIPLFREKKFAVPLEANLNYTQPLYGRNVARDGIASFELVMYF